jgi:sugar phosphate isomerase/epimerase
VPRRFLRYMQLCDARPERPADMQEIIRQARSDRLFPGEGGLDLHGLLAALPAGLPLSLEVPVSRKMQPLERARQALEAARAILTMGEHA